MLYCFDPAKFQAPLGLGYTIIKCGLEAVLFNVELLADVSTIPAKWSRLLKSPPSDFISSDFDRESRVSFLADRARSGCFRASRRLVGLSILLSRFIELPLLLSGVEYFSSAHSSMFHVSVEICLCVVNILYVCVCTAMLIGYIKYKFYLLL